MIEGNFRDVSLPGLLQFLASETNKSYRVKVSSGTLTGEIFVCKGAVLSAVFGLLEGEDAVSEFLAWRDGAFGVELLNQQFEIKKNLHLPIKPTSTFVDQSSYLVEQSIGLNSLMISSPEFGGEMWQESLKIQPLDRDDFGVLAWLGDGRTMRQAMREFNFDIVKATGILFRLVTTRSVQVLRVGKGEPIQEEVSITQDLDQLPNPATIQRFVTTGGQEAAAASVAQQAARAFAADELSASVAQDAFVSTSFKVVAPEEQTNKPEPAGHAENQGREELAQARASLEARLRAKRRGATSISRLPGAEVSEHQPADADTGKAGGADDLWQPAPASAPAQTKGSSPVQSKREQEITGPMPAYPQGQTAASQEHGEPLSADHGAGNERSGEAASSGGADSARRDALEGPLPSSSSESKEAGLEQAPEPTERDASPSASSESSHQSSSESLNEASNEALNESSREAQPDRNQVEAAAQAAALGQSRPAEPVSDATPVDAAPARAVPGQPAEPDSASHGASSGDPQPAPSQPAAPALTPTAPQPSAWVKPSGSHKPVQPAATNPNQPALHDQPVKVRTGALPLVTLDIERLLQATYTLTQFGRLALTNPSLDQLRRQTLNDVEAGKTLVVALAEGSRQPAAVLSSYRYCLDRGYIETKDAVIPLTADLLLGRVELDQYLLQRRRITGDELRDLIQISRSEGLKLPQLLLRNGYLTAGDLDTLTREQKRFAFR